MKLYARAYRDLDRIYTYIATNLSEPTVALQLVQALEEAIFSLEQLPERGALRRVGAFANHNYRQIFVKKFLYYLSCTKRKKGSSCCNRTLCSK